MRLGKFIDSSIEPILVEWVHFARSIAPGANMDDLALRDHAADILVATAADMRGSQDEHERSQKSKGHRAALGSNAALNNISASHAIGRLESGFDLLEVVSEYRALRASVLRLWADSGPAPLKSDVDDITRFNESIDQLMSASVRSYTERVNQARDMFLAILSHDLRNPLNSVAMSAQALPLVDHDEAAKYSAQITTNVEVMARMISDLLDYTRTRLGTGMPVTPAAMDLAVLGRALFDEFRTGHPDRDIRFHADGDTAGAWDADRLRQAISNLMGNALQHGDGNQPVELNIAGKDQVVSIKVTNGGPPIPPSEMTHIFDPLVRGLNTNQRHRNRPGSIGLGLYIAREVAKSHNGRIDINSTPAATSFTICLPREHGKNLPPVMDEEQFLKM